MIWKQFLRLAIISVVFLVIFSGVWHYSSSQNQILNVKTEVAFQFYNNTSSSIGIVTSPNSLEITSYGNGGELSYYDGVRVNGTIQPVSTEYVIYFDSGSSSFNISINNLSYGSSGTVKLGLKPGFYNVTAFFFLNIYTGKKGMTAAQGYQLSKNVSGTFITILNKPQSTIYIYPFVSSIFVLAVVIAISVLELGKFNRGLRKK